LPIGFNPTDWLAYAALVRQAAETGGLPLANPFTTAPQDGRYVLLFHALVGQVCRWTGLDPFVALELSRIPLLFVLLAVVWRLTGVVLDGVRQREVACWLVFMAGGFDALALLFVPRTAARVWSDLAGTIGWSTFTAAYNPLWIAGLALTAWILPPLVRPAGPRGAGDAARVSGGLVVLAATHAYSALVVAAVACARPLLDTLLGRPRARTLRAVLPGLAGMALLGAWQSGDEVYRQTARQVFGPHAISPLWYPVTLGALGACAVAGWRRWLAERNPVASGLAAWTSTVAALHAAPWLNGYHFVFHLHLPVCLAAAPVVARVLDAPGGRRRLRTVLVLLLLQTPLVATIQAVKDVDAFRLPPAHVAIVARLAELPAGHVMADATIGRLVPAFAAHRVFVGHWFMTPDYAARRETARRLTQGAMAADEVRAVLARDAIRWVVAPAPMAAALAGGSGAHAVARGPDAVVLETPP
jgi:hypothetical protein